MAHDAKIVIEEDDIEPRDGNHDDVDICVKAQIDKLGGYAEKDDKKKRQYLLAKQFKKTKESTDADAWHVAITPATDITKPGGIDHYLDAKASAENAFAGDLRKFTSEILKDLKKKNEKKFLFGTFDNKDDDDFAKKVLAALASSVKIDPSTFALELKSKTPIALDKELLNAKIQTLQKDPNDEKNKNIAAELKRFSEEETLTQLNKHVNGILSKVTFEIENPESATQLNIIYNLEKFDYDFDALQAEIKRLDEADSAKIAETDSAKIAETDVFDEIESNKLFEQDCKVKILIPCLNPPLKTKGSGHWSTGEIQIEKKGDTFTVNVLAHNPFGGGKMVDGNFKKICSTIEKRIKNIAGKNVKINFNDNKDSTGKKRQKDSESCWIIAAKDIALLARDEKLPTEAYPIGAFKLRKEVFDKVNDAPDNVISEEEKKKFLEENKKKQPSVVVKPSNKKQQQNSVQGDKPEDPAQDQQKNELSSPDKAKQGLPSKDLKKGIEKYSKDNGLVPAQQKDSSLAFFAAGTDTPVFVAKDKTTTTNRSDSDAFLKMALYHKNVLGDTSIIISAANAESKRELEKVCDGIGLKIERSSIKQKATSQNQPDMDAMRRMMK